MIKKILTIIIFTALLASSCKQTSKQENSKQNAQTVTDTTTTVATDTTTVVDEIVTNTAKDKDGKILDMSFNNTKGTATIKFNGETIELTEQKSASGIWYKNDNFELRGKGEKVELQKDGKTVFSN